jgi:hypothetical protein
MFIETKNFPDIEKILSKGQGYRKKGQCEIREFKPMTLNSNWFEGSRNFYTLVNLTNFEILSIGDCGNLGQPKAPELEVLPKDYCLLEEVMFCGKPFFPRIYVNVENLPKYLESPKVELTKEEDDFFQEYRTLKSSYRPKNERIKNSLIEKGILAKNGAVTILGKNIPRKNNY